jgi:hypothetical protein
VHDVGVVVNRQLSGRGTVADTPRPDPGEFQVLPQPDSSPRARPRAAAPPSAARRARAPARASSAARSARARRRGDGRTRGSGGERRAFASELPREWMW